MERNEFLNLINKQAFFEKYAPEIKMHKFKCRGVSSNGKTGYDFTDEDKKILKQAAKRMAKDLQKVNI